jgi:NTE family protein
MTDTNDPIDWTGKKKVNLALQGGGLHGAFTWGVLDYLLEDARLDIEAITGTSAGAMNAVVLAEGYLEGGRAGARKNLDKFWRSISDADVFLPPSESSWICFLDCRCRRWPRNGGPIFSPIIRALTISIP